MKPLFITIISLLISFQAETQNHSTIFNSNTDDEKVSKKAEFPGGEKALVLYVKNHFTVPKKERENHLHTTIIITSYVSSDGTIIFHDIEGSSNVRLHKAAKDLIDNMPKWKPALVNGKVKEQKVKFAVRLETY